LHKQRTSKWSPEENRVILRVRVIRKLAERLNGVDLSKVRVGDSLDVSSRDGRMLIAEGWAELVEVVAEETRNDRP
jgi:hypothetical protein